jgi:fructokinase
MRDIVCFGEVLVDFLAEPTAGRELQRFTRYAGGAPANVAVAVAKLGARAVFVGMLGQDMFGDFLFESLRAAGVETGYIARTIEANTGLAFVSLDAHGERRFVFYRPPAADLLFRPQHFQDACFAGSGVFHVCSNSLTDEPIAATTLDGMTRAREAGALVSFDINFRPALWPRSVDPQPRLWATLHEADLVKMCGAEFAYLGTALGGEQALLSKLWSGRTALLVVTDGASPIRYFTPASGGSTPAFSVKAIDTNAAGDAFIGGLLYRLAEGNVDAATLAAFAANRLIFEDALRFAAACGALAVTRHGAFSALPTLVDVQNFFAAHP